MLAIISGTGRLVGRRERLAHIDTKTELSPRILKIPDEAANTLRQHER